MAVCFTIIIIVVAGFLITISYLDTREEIVAQNENLKEYTERYVIESVVKPGCRYRTEPVRDVQSSTSGAPWVV